MRRLALLLFTTVLLVACDETDDEAQIEANIAAMKEAVEAKEFSVIQDHLHADFVANERMGVKEVKRLLQLYSMQHRRLGVSIVGSRTDLDPIHPDRAETVLSVILTGSSGLLPTDGSVRTVNVEWIEDSGDWLVRKASWQR